MLQHSRACPLHPDLLHRLVADSINLPIYTWSPVMKTGPQRQNISWPLMGSVLIWSSIQSTREPKLLPWADDLIHPWLQFFCM